MAVLAKASGEDTYATMMNDDGTSIYDWNSALIMTEITLQNKMMTTMHAPLAMLKNMQRKPCIILCLSGTVTVINWQWKFYLEKAKHLRSNSVCTVL
jgi:hypothetical protein